MRSITVLLALSMLVYAGDGELKWEFQTGGEIYSSPAIASDGTIYVGSYDSCLYAFSPDGILKWRYKTGDYVYSSPAVGSDGTVYVGSGDGCIYAFNPDSSLKWRYQTGAAVESSPALGFDGTVYVGSLDGYLYALNPDSTLAWRFPTGNGVFSSPAVSFDSIIYAGSNDSTFYAVNPDGSLKWSYQTQGRVISSPAIAEDGTVYFGSEDDNIYALNPDGSLKWQRGYACNENTSPVVGAEGIIYFAYGFNRTGWDHGGFVALYPQDGSAKWVFGYYPEMPQSSIPVAGADGTVYIGYNNTQGWGGGLEGIDPDGPKFVWYYDAGTIGSSPNIASDGTTYFGETDSSFCAVTCPSLGLADSPWPKFRHDNQNTGRAHVLIVNIEEQSGNSNSLKVNASAVSNTIKVNFTLPQGQIGILRVYNVSGQRIVETGVTSSGEVEFNNLLSKGVYLVRLESGGSSATAKAVIMR